MHLPSPPHVHTPMMKVARLLAVCTVAAAVVFSAGCMSPAEQVALFCPSFEAVVADKLIAPEYVMLETTKRWEKAGADSEVMRTFHEPIVSAERKQPGFWPKVHAAHKAKGYAWSCPKFEAWYSAY